jgi:hypothetical protein
MLSFVEKYKNEISEEINLGEQIIKGVNGLKKI